MYLKNLSNETLLSRTKHYVQREKEMTLQVLHHIKEVERRRLFASLSYSSLFEYVTRELGYCPASACRRIDAMRLIKEMPELEEKIQEGSLSLSTVARAQSFFKKEQSATPNKPVSQIDKQEIMAKLENKSTRQVEKELLSLSSTPEAHFHERVKPVTPQLSEVKFYATDELLQDLEKLKGLLGHSHPGMTMADLIAYLAKLGLKELDPATQETKRSSNPAAPSDTATPPQITPAPNESARQSARSSNSIRSRYIPRSLVRAVWKRDESKCTWVDPKTGRKCGATYKLQIDHIEPFALGGKTEFSNLRLLCAQHNLFEAERIFGRNARSYKQL